MSTKPSQGKDEQPKPEAKDAEKDTKPNSKDKAPSSRPLGLTGTGSVKVTG